MIYVYDALVEAIIYGDTKKISNGLMSNLVLLGYLDMVYPFYRDKTVGWVSIE